MRIKRGMYEIERYMIRHEFNVYERYLGLLEPHIENILVAWEEAINQEANQIEDSEQRDTFFEAYSDEYHEFTQMNVLLMNSFFCSCFALFEEHLVRICDKAKSKRDCPFSVGDLKGSLSDRVKKFLRRLDIAIPTDSSEWPEITKYIEIRNKIMHDGALVGRKWDHIDYAEGKGIVPTGGIELELTRSFCKEALENYRRFLIMVHIAYEEGVREEVVKSNVITL